MVNNKNLMGLAKQGSYFVYDTQKLFNHATKLQQGHAKLFFACKANPLSGVLSTINKAKIDFDVASIGELKQVLSLKVNGSRIIMTGPAKSETFLRLALKNKVGTFVIESPNQLFLLQKLAPEYGYNPSVLLRLQLRWHNQGKSVLGGDEITPFGMDLTTAKELLQKITLPFLGFHVFQWGNILDINRLEEIWTATIKACKDITQDFKVLDVGGGLGISYSQESKELDWDDVNNLILKMKTLHNIPEFWVEMGRYLVAPCGIYITSVVDVKNTYNKNIVVLEGGINHIARPALINSFFPAQLLRSSVEPTKKFALHGPLCTSLDYLGEFDLPCDIKVGDAILFQQVGAYGFTESMPFFLCHNLAGEATINGDTITVLREPQPASWWLK